ncbi:MAG TPA: MoaD/ThiS family protein [Gemmatimonadaceae bacterium]|jgi:molybdopterin converting factor subunit 1|nr:MoaD/ThiS family protein [Gemmatimonadaceae bacterium]
MYDATLLMTVTVLLFASYADALGAASLDLEMPSDTTVTQVVAAVRARPGAQRLPAAPLVAVNLQYANGDRVVRDGDEVALIPPVAGG